jgi:hypothetical protein
MAGEALPYTTASGLLKQPYKQKMAYRTTWRTNNLRPQTTKSWSEHYLGIGPTLGLSLPKYMENQSLTAISDPAEHRLFLSCSARGAERYKAPVLHGPYLSGRPWILQADAQPNESVGSPRCPLWAREKSGTPGGRRSGFSAVRFLMNSAAASVILSCNGPGSSPS